MILRPLTALGAGLAVALSLPPWGWWPLSFVGVALFELTMAAPWSASATTRPGRFGLGFLFGLGWLAMGMAWMWELTIPGYIVAAIIFASWHGVAELVLTAGPSSRGEGRWLVFTRPLAHTLVEALRFSFPFGGVPLASLGIAQAAGPFAGLARVGGVILITWVVFQVGVALGTLVGPWIIRRGATPVERTEPGAGPFALGALGVVTALVALSLVAPRGHDTAAALDIVAVQGGGEQGTRALDVPSHVVTERHLEATASIEPDPGIDLVVWPENVVDVADFASSEQLGAISEQAARLDVPIAVGVTEDIAGRPGRITNAELIVTPSGEVVSRYDKVRRVPFGEYVPLRGVLEALGAPVDQVPSDAIAGTDPAVLDVPVDRDGPGVERVERIAVVISWEVFFGGRARDGVRAGGGLVLNPTNGATYSGTIVQTQQIASSRLRAIETGRWVVQVAPTGFSAFVTPGGDVIDRTAVGERAVIRHVVPLRAGATWYLRLGDGPIILLALVAFVAILVYVKMRDRMGRAS